MIFHPLAIPCRSRKLNPKAQKGNKEKKKPKADKNQPKTHVSPYKAAQDQAKPSFNPFAKKT